MITAVDTNVLIDVFTGDETYAEASATALEQSIQQGRVIACDIVWAETCALFPNDADFEKAMRELDITLSPMTEACAQQAGANWRQYRKQGGKRTRMIADFMIGAHALTQCDRLLTRDRGFFRKYFSKLTVLDPSTALKRL
jgi:predicted nucleic acid-binding protein